MRNAHNTNPFLRTTCVVTALAFYFSLGAPYVARAQQAAAEQAAPVLSVELTEGAGDESAADREAWSEEGETSEEEGVPGAEAPAEEDRPVAERALPSGEAKSAVTPQAISLPKAEGSIEGMGESFTPSLSAGTATFSIPIALPKGRAGVQPSLELAYSTGAGNGNVGIGWSLAVPYIARQTDKGLPRYIETADGRWHEEEDTFIYNGGQELVPVDNARATQLDGAPVPAEFTAWQQYRARVEGAFMRFFRSPDGLRWVVQDKGGSRFDFGVLPSGQGSVEANAASIDSLMRDDEDGATRTFSWGLTRMSDAHGSTIYYQYQSDAGQRYLSDIYYVSPATCAATTVAAQRDCAASLDTYGRHVRLVYEDRDDAFDNYITTWRVTTALRLRRIEVAALEADAAERSLVRRYHLRYDPSSFLSLLSELLVEGRPETISTHSQMPVGDRHYPEGSLNEDIVGATLPPMRFSYTQPAATTAGIDGFPGISALVHESASSPAHSLDEARTDLFDVNSDGLPDIIVTDPARYRTADDQPAVGVFFNGFSGPNATATQAGEFSEAVPVPMPSAYSSVMHLGNLNVAPMDIDGDGRSDLLHMPRTREYGYFTPVRDPDGAIPPASPIGQGYRFTRVPVQLSNGAIDPRIDLGRDGRFIKTMDVDNDHLIDIVQSTGTGLLTWLNLGRYPDGDGLFGHATWSGGAWQLSPEPLDSCLLQEGLPIDFEDSQLRLGDMNGDGLQDIIKIRQGRVIYWPGRGPGLWGDGAATCFRGEGEGREIEMLDSPEELNAELDGVFLSDVNQDGADDIVQVRFDALDVWWNRAGHAFTGRVTARGTPYAPSFTATIRFADIDGTGTTDIVYGRGGALQWVDPMGGQKPRLLQVVENGLGGLTEIEYGSSAEDYLRDLHDAETCADSSCDRFTWSFVRGECDQKIESASGECARRSGSSPVVSTVVRASVSRDQMQRLGREEHVKRAEYAYHDAYYEGIEQEFRGFGAADAIAWGDAGQPTSISRSYFHQGRRPAEIASDRLAENPDEALKGREYRTELFDESGGYLSTRQSALTVRELLRGLNDAAIFYAFVSRNDELRYDTAPFAPASGAHAPDPLNGNSLDFVLVRREIAGSGLNAHMPASGEPPQVGRLRLRSARYAHLVQTTDDVDNVGNVRQSTARGRARGEFAEVVPLELVVSHTVPTRVDATATGAWLWRTAESYVTGHGDEGLLLGRAVNVYNSRGDALSVTRPVSVGVSIPSFVFGGDPQGAASYSTPAQASVSSMSYDSWGNAVRSCAGADIGESGQTLTGCLRFSETLYEPIHSQFPMSESTAVAGSTTAFELLTSEAVWDQGHSKVLTVTDPNRLSTNIEYDGFGRFSSLTPPNVLSCEGAAVPTTRVRYALAVDGLPISTLTTYTEQSCAALGADSLVARVYVDGHARNRASLSEAEDVRDPRLATGVRRSGLGTFYSKGAAGRTFQTDRLQTTIASIAPSAALALPSTPSTQTLYDAFDRPVLMVAEDLSTTRTRYHALSHDVWDPLDQDPSSPHFGTPKTERSDGHGRAIDSIIRNRQQVGSAIETYRLFTTYRADGMPTTLTRAQTADDRERSTAMLVNGRTVSRSFFYDSRGRRIGGSDRDTDAAALPAGQRGWRYLFNRVDDMVAVRDPRGCGQNFFYDRAGRLIGEDYVQCGEAQVSGEVNVDTLPSGTIAFTDNVAAGTAVDVRYYFDSYPDWFDASNNFDLPPAGATRTMGRATGVIDRGQRSVLAYDDRGNVVWQARQMAVIPSADSIALTLANPPAVDTTDAIALRPAVYDAPVYVTENRFDHAGRARSVRLPTDPDYAGTPPRIGGVIDFNARGLPFYSAVTIDETRQTIIERVDYTRDGLTESVTFGDSANGERSPTVSTTHYDVRRRPDHSFTVRDATALPDSNPATGRALGAVTVVSDQRMLWDEANNLVGVQDLREGTEWRNGYRPASYALSHDALYRVTDVEYDYTRDDGTRVPSDSYTDYRDQLELVEPEDPMRTDPAPRLPAPAAGRVASMTFEYDWLANSVDWTDDAAQFYERSLGRITNGQSEAGDRPTALRLASDLPTTSHSVNTTTDRGGYVEADYGSSGNLVSLTAHAQCRDRTGLACFDPATATVANRRTQLRNNCACSVEQHYQYRWDELNRLADARRYDRPGSGSWTLAARQRYRYDATNTRTIKQVMDITTDVTGEVDITPASERVALYVYPGDFERRGLVRLAGATPSYDASAMWESESQYLVAGARIVIRSEAAPIVGRLDREMRATFALTDLIHSTSGVIDLFSGALVETSTYYPNGARETYRAPDGPGDVVAAEPLGFTGKEADEEIGLTYFGERYLAPRLGRWASPDPLSIHAASGGEAGNAYHYVGGNLLQARDPIGLECSSDWRSSCNAFDLSAQGGMQDLKSSAQLSGDRERGLAALTANGISAEQRPGVVGAMYEDGSLGVVTTQRAQWEKAEKAKQTEQRFYTTAGIGVGMIAAPLAVGALALEGTAATATTTLIGAGVNMGTTHMVNSAGGQQAKLELTLLAGATAIAGSAGSELLSKTPLGKTLLGGVMADAAASGAAEVANTTVGNALQGNDLTDGLLTNVSIQALGGFAGRFASGSGTTQSHLMAGDMTPIEISRGGYSSYLERPDFTPQRGTPSAAPTSSATFEFAPSDTTTSALRDLRGMPPPLPTSK